MAYEYDGKTIETNDSGYLLNPDDWSEGLAQVIATEEGLGELTEKHWDIINYLRDEYYNNAQTQPNERTILKAMGDKWGAKIGQKDTFALFPLMPSKQGGKVAGLPESRRKGGY
jgi:tRNA 2-thiouridine synthesizing protein E